MLKVLRLLSDGLFHSGEELGEMIGVSRSSIWKYLQRIERDYGIELHRIPGKGYRLAEALSLLNAEGINDALSPYGWRLHFFDEVDSTNAEALRLLRSDASAPFVVLAESQTDGRGRRGRRWKSPAVQNIYFTLALRVTGGGRALSGLSLVVGLAVRRTLDRLGVSDCGVKWPNDVYTDNRKIAGILLELTGDPADVCHVVIGIGINVNMDLLGIDVDQPWTSVKQRLGQSVDRNDLVGHLVESLHNYLCRHAEEGFAPFRAEWESENIWQGRRCTLRTGAFEVRGLVLGVDDQGALRLLIDGAGEQSFSGGELSLRLENDS